MVICFVQIFFVGQREFFLQIITLGYMTKTLNQIILFYFIFPPPKSEYFFQQHRESEYLNGSQMKDGLKI